MDNPFEFHEEDAIIACVGENGGTTDEDIRNGFKRTVELLTESLKDGQEVEDPVSYTHLLIIFITRNVSIR